MTFGEENIYMCRVVYGLPVLWVSGCGEFVKLSFGKISGECHRPVNNR